MSVAVHPYLPRYSLNNASVRHRASRAARPRASAAWIRQSEGTWRLRRATLVSVMKTTDFRNCDDLSGACRLHRSAVGRVLAQSEMRPTSVIVRHVGGEQSAQMRLAEHDDVVETLASN